MNPKNKMNKKTKKQTVSIIFGVIFILLASFINGLQTDFHDNYYAAGTTDDKISWIESECPTFTPDYVNDDYMVFGVFDSSYDVYAYCVNTDRDSDSDYDICLIKNDTFFDDSVLVGLTFPALAYVETETANDWAESLNLFSDNNIYESSPVCDGEDGNVLFRSSKAAKRAQVQYYGIANPIYNTQLLYTGDRCDISQYCDVGYVRGVTSFAQRFNLANDILRTLTIKLEEVSNAHNLQIYIRSTLNGANLVHKNISYNSLNVGFNNILINENLGNNNYYVILDCPDCTSGSDEYAWAGGNEQSISYCANNLLYRSFDDTTWTQPSSTCLSIKVFGDDGIRSLGTTANDDSQNYFFIDQTLSTCNVDGGDFYSIDGRFDTNSYINIESTRSCFDTYGPGYICDAQHDETTSSSPLTIPAETFCKLESGMACSNSAECWHDISCSGARTEYDGYCSGNNVILETIPYDNSCGGEGNVGTITSSAPSSCQANGLPIGYVCDSTYEYITRTTQNAVYLDICKASYGTFCSVDSDCKTGLSCQNNFCGYFSWTTYTKNISGNSINQNEYITFDPELSIGNDIQYACWIYNQTNDKCYGNSANCSAQCNGATYSGANWQTTYSKQFTNPGQINIMLKTGESGLYGSNYSENFCVSGNGINCFSCYDNLKNDDETYIDWGGHCGFPYFVKCNNNIKDNVTNESSIDYGGDCGQCDNSSANTDQQWNILKQGDLIVYPFNLTLQCPKADEITGGVTTFVLIIVGILGLLLFIIIAALLISLGYGIITSGSALAVVGRRLYDYYKRRNKEDKKK